jgi:hypothetical protein
VNNDCKDLQTKFLIAKVLYGIHMSVITRNQFCI